MFYFNVYDCFVVLSYILEEHFSALKILAFMILQTRIQVAV